MSWYDYRESLKVSETDPGFYALIMAAYRKADTDNAAKLEFEWPEICEELRRRYAAPGGFLPGELRDSETLRREREQSGAESDGLP